MTSFDSDEYFVPYITHRGEKWIPLEFYERVVKIQQNKFRGIAETGIEKAVDAAWEKNR